MRVGSSIPKKLTLFLSLAACLATLGVMVYGQLGRGLDSVAPRHHRPIKAPSHHSIEGFRYSASHEGRPVLQISSDHFEIHKKKIGKLRFGLLHEAVFSNARIKLFDPEKMVPTPAQGADQPGSNEEERKVGAAPPTDVFGHAFRPDLIPSFQSKRVVTVIFKPIQIDFFSKDRKQIAVTAEKALLNLKKRKIEFTGNVQWRARSKSILTDRLIVSLPQSKLYCPSTFTLNDRNNIEHGRELHTDFFLRPASVADRHGRQNLVKMYGEHR